MSKINLNADLFLGSQELNRLTKSLDDSGFRKILLQNSLGFGIVNNSINGNFNNFIVTQGINVGSINVADGIAINSDGNLITHYSEEISLTNDNLWRWVTIEHQFDKREQGLCSIDANGNLSFPNGELLSILRGLPNNPVKVKFTNATTNVFEYEVTEVIDNNNAVLAGDFSSESNLRLAVVGAFTPDTVTPEASKYPYQYDGCILTLTLESVLNTPPALVANKQFTIARVKRNGSTITIEDKRTKIYETKTDFNLSSVGTNDNPLIGVESVRYNNNLTPKDENIVQLAWGFRSSNWTIDSSTNRLTLIAGNGGKFKSTSDFSDGQFDNWRVYAKDGSYSVVKQSSKIATQINLILDTMDVDKFSDTTQQIAVVPDADEIELVFTPDIADATDLTAKTVSFHINNGSVSVPLTVYKSPLCKYTVKYRYKGFKVWNKLTAIPSDLTYGYLVEASFNSNGVLTGSTRQTYTSSDTVGFITLILSTDAYSNRIASVETGDLFGVGYKSLDNANPLITYVVGTDKQHQIITNDDDLDASDSDFGTTFTLTTNHFISLSSLLPSTLRNGNSFKLQFRGDYNLGGFNLVITQDYVNPGNIGILLHIITADDLAHALRDSFIVECKWDGNRWFVHRETDGINIGSIAGGDLSGTYPNPTVPGLALKANKSQPAWTDLTLLSPWVNAGDALYPPRYRITDQNKLEIAGRVSRTTGGVGSVTVSNTPLTATVTGISSNRIVPNISDQTIAILEISFLGLFLTNVPDNKTIDIGAIFPYSISGGH